MSLMSCNFHFRLATVLIVVVFAGCQVESNEFSDEEIAEIERLERNERKIFASFWGGMSARQFDYVAKNKIDDSQIWYGRRENPGELRPNEYYAWEDSIRYTFVVWETEYPSELTASFSGGRLGSISASIEGEHYRGSVKAFYNVLTEKYGKADRDFDEPPEKEPLREEWEECRRIVGSSNADIWEEAVCRVFGGSDAMFIDFDLYYDHRRAYWMVGHGDNWVRYKWKTDNKIITLSSKFIYPNTELEYISDMVSSMSMYEDSPRLSDREILDKFFDKPTIFHQERPLKDERYKISITFEHRPYHEQQRQRSEELKAKRKREEEAERQKREDRQKSRSKATIEAL